MAVRFQTQDKKLQKLFDIALEKCQGNLQWFGDRKVLVEGGGYEKIWLETQPMGGEMYALHCLEAALNNQLLFMEHQRADGRLPGSIKWEGGKIVPEYNKFQGFCFPDPAMNLYYLSGKDKGYLDKLEKTLEAFDDYLWRHRDSNGDGILESWCVYDTGEDNALRYRDAPNYALGENPPEGYAIVPMASMDIMSFSYAYRKVLTEIAEEKGNGKEEYWRKKAKEVSDALEMQLWDEEKGACFDKDKNGKRVDVLTHNNLRCMWWGSFSQHMADEFVSRHLLNPEEFWTPFPLPSVAADDKLFRNAPENNWSGQSEGLTYQRVIAALERYGYYPVVTELGKKLFDAVAKGGYVFTQQFDPFTCAPSKVGMYSHEVLGENAEEEFQDSYGPTILSVLEYIAHIYGIHLERDEVWYSLGTSDYPYCYEVEFAGHRYGIQSDGKDAEVYFDETLVAKSPCGRRVIFDGEGNIKGCLEIE